MGSVLLHFVLSIITAYSIGLSVWLLLRRKSKLNQVARLISIIGISSCPLLISPEAIIARAFACLILIDLLFRILDIARQLRQGTIDRLTWHAYWTFLIPFPFLLTVFGQKRQITRKHSRHGTDWTKLSWSLLICAFALVVCFWSHQVALLRESFLLDHLVKMVAFIICAEAASGILVVLESAAGFNNLPLVHRAYLAQTPAEFWYRFNQRVRHWLYLNIFLPCGGRYARPSGIIATCLVSAIFHEVFFALATSRLDGYQFVFFAIQAPAIMLSPKLKRLARRRAVWKCIVNALTFLWFAFTSTLFFHGFNRVFPFFYASEPWLP